jgi:hypothetical protein
MRVALDGVSPLSLSSGFRLLGDVLDQTGLLKQYRLRQNQLLVSIDGVEHFHSTEVNCPYCLVKTHKDGIKHYSHQMLVAVIVHPDQREVFPIGCEAIIQQDGIEKNDTERNAAKRLLDRLGKDYPDWKFIVVEDGLYSNGPHLRQLQSHQMAYLIGAKPADHKGLFQAAAARNARGQGNTERIEEENGTVHFFEWANNLPLNHSHADIRVNLLQYTQTRPNGEKTSFSWIVQWKLTRSNLMKTMRMGRARWKIENETFNTLKNQGYHFEHNFGHGSKNLATVLAIIMLLAFAVDQIQQHASKAFKLILNGLKTRKKLWSAMRAAFAMQKATSMTQLWEHIAWEYRIKMDTS